MLDIKEVTFDISLDHWDLMSRNLSYIGDMRSTSGLLAAYLSPRETSKLHIVGPEVSIKSAKIMFPTILDYMNRQIEISQFEQRARKELYDFNRSVLLSLLYNIIIIIIMYYVLCIMFIITYLFIVLYFLKMF